jgi:protein-S-isoprenylcysteine O-methyltransferase Ste14
MRGQTEEHNERVGIFLVIRTALEDKTLQEELDGYRVYAQKVPYRLVPGIW